MFTKIQGSVDTYNQFLKVRSVSSSEQLTSELFNLVQTKPREEQMIIFCVSCIKVDELYEKLISQVVNGDKVVNGMNIHNVSNHLYVSNFVNGNKNDERMKAYAKYHSKMSTEEKERTVKEFCSGSVKIVISTSGFGAGIDVAHIRHIVHVGISYSIIDYVQEIGRGGRDGKGCVATFLHANYDDYVMNKAMDKDVLEYVNMRSKCRHKWLMDMLNMEAVECCLRMKTPQCDFCIKLFVNSYCKSDASNDMKQSATNLVNGNVGMNNDDELFDDDDVVFESVFAKVVGRNVISQDSINVKSTLTQSSRNQVANVNNIAIGNVPLTNNVVTVTKKTIINPYKNNNNNNSNSKKARLEFNRVIEMESTSVHGNVTTQVQQLNKVMVFLRSFGKCCHLCSYINRNHDWIHSYKDCPQVRGRCFNCFGKCKGGCKIRPQIPSGHCFMCFLPCKYPDQSMFHEQALGKDCQMIARDTLLPLVWMYWERNTKELIQRYGYEKVGTRELMMKWLMTLDDCVLNIINIGALMSTK